MLAMGMITSPRPGLDVNQSIDYLREGGFDGELHLFCEPQTPPIRPADRVIEHRNGTQRGCVGNWRFCLGWLVEHLPASHFLICEDDVRFCRGARAGLEQALARFEDFGFISLYTPWHDSKWIGHERGWVEYNYKSDMWGTQAMCFSRTSAMEILDFKRLQDDDQLRGPTDYIVLECFHAKKPCYYHRPSLADHLGKVSTIQHNWHADHVGLEFDPAFVPVVASSSAKGLPDAYTSRK